MWIEVVGTVLGAAVVAALFGTRRWNQGTAALIAKLEASRERPRVARYGESELEGLPQPVQRYFRRTLRPGQPMVRTARHTQQGEFHIKPGETGWRPLTASQINTGRPAGLVWDARIRMFPGVSVNVRDGYVGGRGSMRARIFGLIPVADAFGKPELDAGALQRHLGEAMWFPTALLPSQGVRWSPLGTNEARATLTDGSTTVSLDFRFNAEGDVAGSYTAARYAEEGGHFVPRPWEARCWEHAERGGMRIPLQAEVAWHRDGQVVPYWRARVTHIDYEFED